MPASWDPPRWRDAEAFRRTPRHGFAGYMDLQSRMPADMSWISVRERTFATMTVDVFYQTLQESFRAHVGPERPRRNADRPKGTAGEVDGRNA
jgi:hypothetical protein